jgi:hypothetical protein
MADEQPSYQQPVQHQPNVADDPKGQHSGVRGVPVEVQGKTMEDATGLPKTGEKLDQVTQQTREIRDQQHAADEKNPGENQEQHPPQRGR